MHHCKATNPGTKITPLHLNGICPWAHLIIYVRLRSWTQCTSVIAIPYVCNKNACILTHI